MPDAPDVPGRSRPAAPGARAGRAVLDAAGLLAVCHDVADAVAGALQGVHDWSPAGERRGQYAIDLVADEAALRVLDRPGLGVLSEESGLHRPDEPFVAVVDPVDGSTNAARGIPWYATSVCVVDDAGPLVAVVANQASGERYEAVRGSHATRDGRPIHPSAAGAVGSAVVALNGYPDRYLGWAQFRAFGAAALDLCAVADGRVDAFAVCRGADLAPWDYLGGVLVCREAGAVVEPARRVAAGAGGGQAGPDDLVVLQPSARRGLVAAGTASLCRQLVDAVGGRPAGSPASGA